MSADHRNPRLDATAARAVANAMMRVHPAQRRELLIAMQGHIGAALAVIDAPAVRRVAA